VITVLGASGFIGSNIIAYLQRAGLEFEAVGRDQQWPSGALGDVIYCIGVTADFRERPYDAVDAHVCTLVDFVRRASFDSLLYLSSARVYLGRTGVAREDDDVTVNPLRFEDLYSVSKLMGESIVLSLGAKGRVARLSNAYGCGQSETFLARVLEEVRVRGAITFHSAAESVRDFARVDDVAEVLVKIASGGRERLYNIASGVSVTNAELADALARHSGCRVTFRDGAPAVVFPCIDNERIRREFGFTTVPLLDALPAMIGGRT
jgi:nucleoside-diphosphate-sugar epimerase